MLRPLLRRVRRAPRRSPGLPARPGLEQLEDRNSPSGLTELIASWSPPPLTGGDFFRSDKDQKTILALASVAGMERPTIVNFKCVDHEERIYVFSGRVLDANPGNLTVRLGGIPSLANATAITRPDGSFEHTAQLQPREEGIAEAVVTNTAGLISPIAEYVVEPQ